MPRIQQTVTDFWRPSYDTYYDAYYQEMAYIAVSDDLQGVEMITKALVAVTATGSAIAGLSLWSDPTLEACLDRLGSDGRDGFDCRQRHGCVNPSQGL